MKQFPLFIIILSITLHSTVKACCYNTDCNCNYYSVDACFMEVTFPEQKTEGFCWGGSCYPCGVDWSGNTNWCGQGSCRCKQTMGDSCQNSASNYDNNNCVTELCSSSTGKCELRDSGCASLADCTSLGLNIAAALAAYSDPFGGAVTFTSSSCSSSYSCTANGDAALEENDLTLTINTGTALAQELQLIGTIGLNLPDDIHFDMSLSSSTMEFYLENMAISTSLEVLIKLEAFEHGEIEQDLILSHEAGVCKDPYDKKGICRPYIIFKKLMKVGSGTVELEVGFQILAKMTLSGKATSAITIGFTVSKDVVFTKFGPRISPSGITFEDGGETWDNVMDLVGDVEVKVAGGAQVAIQAALRVSPQLYIKVNGIEVQGGVDFVYQVDGIFTADAASGCVDGGVVAAMGLCQEFYSPPFSLETAMKAACKSTMGWAQELIEMANIAADVASNSYGTHCIAELDACTDSRFDLCDEAASLMMDVMDDMVGSTMSLNAVYVDEVLFENNQEYGVKVNGKTCIFPAEGVSYGGETYYAANSVIDCGTAHTFNGAGDHCNPDTEYTDEQLEWTEYVDENGGGDDDKASKACCHNSNILIIFFVWYFSFSFFNI